MKVFKNILDQFLIDLLSFYEKQIFEYGERSMSSFSATEALIVITLRGITTFCTCFCISKNTPFYSLLIANHVLGWCRGYPFFSKMERFVKIFLCRKLLHENLGWAPEGVPNGICILPAYFEHLWDTGTTTYIYYSTTP